MKLRDYKKITKVLGGEDTLLDILHQALPTIEGSLFWQSLSTHLGSSKPLADFFTLSPTDGGFLVIDSLTNSKLTITIGEHFTGCFDELPQGKDPCGGGVGESFTIPYTVDDTGAFTISTDFVIGSLLS